MAMLTVSHGIDFFGELAHSTERMQALATALAKLDSLAPAERAALREVLLDDVCEPVEIGPGPARQFARVLRRAANSPYLRPLPTAEADLLAQCAERAADAGECWTWRRT